MAAVRVRFLQRVMLRQRVTGLVRNSRKRAWGWGQPYSSWSSWGQPWGNRWGYNYDSWQANDSNQDSAGSWASYQRGDHSSAHADEQSSEESGNSHGQSGSYEPGTTSSRRDSGLESQETTDTGGRPTLEGTTATRTETSGQDSKGGSSERMAVPTFSADKSGDELGSSARSYLRQVDAWCKVTRTPKAQRALILYQHLSGRAWVEAEELDIEALSQDNGVEVFRRWAQERYQEVEVSKIAESLTLFFRRLRREAGQSIREFNSAFDRAHTRLLEIDCRLPEAAKAWAYLNGLGLSSSEELALLGSVGNDYSTAKLQRAAVLHEKSLRTPWRARRAGGTGEGRGVRVNGAFLTDANDEDPVQDDDGAEPLNDDLIPEEAAVELHEAYVAAESAKAKYREVARARGVDPGLLSRDSKDPGKRDSNQDSGYDMRLQAAKAKSFCAGCGRRGHWHKDPECPLNVARQQQTSSSSDKNSAQNPEGNPNMSKEAYVVQVAYEVGYMGGTGLVAITDTACSKSVMGQSWLQKYMKVAQAAGVPMQLLDCQDDFRFGASKLFRATYTATILIPLGEHGDRGFLVRASVAQGEVPLLLSRRALSTLGMLFDVERHAADFKHLDILNYQLLTTENGHPAIPVNPQALQHVRFPTPQEWAGDEVRLILNTQSPCGAYMHEGCQAQGCEPVQYAPKQESALVADGGPAISTSSTSSPNLVKNDPGVHKTIFYPKKLPQMVFNFLSSETLNPDVFMSWWSETNLSKDFWIETSTSFIRAHITSILERGFFPPDQWQTPQSEAREELLYNIGDIRSTEGIACTSMKLLGTQHDLWRDAQDSAHGTLWVGRSIFPRVPPDYGHQAQVGLADDQAGAHPGSPEPGSDSPYQLGERRDKDHSHREAEGGERHLLDSARPSFDEARRAGGEDERVEHPRSAQTNSRPDATRHTRYDSGLERADPDVREAGV